MSKPGTISSPPVAQDLLARVQNALEALEKDSGAGTAAPAAGLVRATREAVAAYRSALTATGEAGPGRVRAYRSLLHRILEAASRRSIRVALDDSPFAAEWTELLLEAVDVSDYSVGSLFFSRARALGDRTLFLLPPSRQEGRISWAGAEAHVLEIGRALLRLRETDDIAPVAILGANSPELALFDLACLVTGTPNVPVPANSPAEQIAFILRHAGCGALFLGDAVLAGAAREGAGDRLPAHTYWLAEETEGPDWVHPLSEFLALGLDVDDANVRAIADRVRSSDLATTMYTSGTTGDPKGVPFTQGNLVSKRFARAAVWPELGEGDVFLCYLPLYHTFGRWLEMLGCVFWGSVYAFVEDVSVSSLLYSFQRVRPTTFISVPKKWMQIAESVAPLTDDDLEARDEKTISAELVAATGGRLRRGLSAAGYLPVSVFRRFHAAGIELHSGFGMTEATGGITMTPAGDYRDDSIGTALPGIELRVAEDGELFIRGPYVTGESDDEPPRPEGWMATGDVVATDAAGHLQIIDRKKEIFKNIGGETISPRRIESLFADFETVERVLVVGDGRAYCTALIVPSAELREEFGEAADGESIDSPELRELFAPLVSTVNRFLAPYERILDFAFLSRDLDAERGELTAKNTPKRKVVRERFADVIEPMYSREHVTLVVGGVAVQLPHWFFRQVGVPSSELRAEGETLTIPALSRALEIRRTTTGVRVGDLEYDPGGKELLLGQILGRAELWIGNEPVRAFAGSGIEHWWRRGRRFAVRTSVLGRPRVERSSWPDLIALASSAPRLELVPLHELSRLLSHPEAERRREAVETLRARLRSAAPEIQEVASAVLATVLDDADVRGEVLFTLVPGLSPEELDELLVGSLLSGRLSGSEIGTVARQPLRGDQLDVVARRAREAATGDREPRDRLFEYLVQQGIRHRANHRRIRSLIVTLADEAPSVDERGYFDRLLDRLAEGLRARLPVPGIADGVSWEEAVEFRGDLAPGDRARILEAISRTRMLPEAMALLTHDRRPPTLKPLVARSVAITFLGTGTGRAIHLLEWAPQGLDQTGPRFECILKVNHDLDWSNVAEERRLLVRARGGRGRPVVKMQGGGYPDQGVWTEEFVPGQTLDRLVDRLAREEEDLAGRDGGGRSHESWQFVLARCAALIVGFWKRTGCKVTLARPVPAKIVLPAHDWQVGGRLVSIADRVRCERLVDVLATVRSGIVEPLRERFPGASVESSWRLLFGASLEVLGEKEGLARLEREGADGVDAGDDTEPIGAVIARFASSVRRHGFLPVRIRIAARRYRRWAQLNPDATLEAQAATLDQIEDAYGLGDLDRERPGSRLQFFRHTVFRGVEDEFAHAFDEILERVVSGSLPKAEWHRAVTSLRERHASSDREEFFLARMLYPHVDPKTRAVLVREEGDEAGFAAGIEVEHRDRKGDLFRIRRPANPTEIGAFYRVFQRANFRPMRAAGQDQLLVVLDTSGRVIGGLVFHRMSDSYVRLEWLVVTRYRQRRGIGSMLLEDFLERLAAQGIRVVSTGFFRPSFFSSHGFGVDPRYAGLVRFLQPDPETDDK